MTDLNSTLLGRAPFVNHCAYTLWRLEENPAGADKKPVKVPVHYDGRTRHSLGRPARRNLPAVAPNPAPPLTAEQALNWLKHNRSANVGHDRSGQIGYLGAGFRPSGTGLVCIDGDDCVRDGKWTPQAEALMARFPGALIELSVSGTGLHIWVTVSGEGPGRLGKQTTPLLGEIEVYGDGQFIAQGQVLGGDACIDHTAAVAALISEFWPARGGSRGRAKSNDWDDLSDADKERVIREVRSTFPHVKQDNYNQWAAAGCALRSMGDEVGLELWHEFSSLRPEYDHEFCDWKWWQLEADRTSYQSLFVKAAESNSGWVNPGARPALGEAYEVFETTAREVVSGDTATPLLGLPAGAVLERPPNVPDPAMGGGLSFMAAAQGQITASLARVAEALRSPESGVKLRYDSFKDDNYISIGNEPWRPITDADVIDLRIRFEQRGFKPVSSDCMNDAIRAICEVNKVDSARDWAEGLLWDGESRINRLMPDYYGTEDSPYTQACGAYLFTALAGRALVPGVKADMAVILVGVQGGGKTTSVEVLSPDPANFGEVDLSKKDADLARSLRGKQVMELAELQGLSGRALEATKAWVSRKAERWVPKFQEREISYLRRMVVVGTTNENEFLDDPTGERRWLPVTVGQVNHARIAAECEQLWAEGVVRFKANGVEWRNAMTLAAPHHAAHKVHDDWLERIEKWLDSTPIPITGQPLRTEKHREMPLILADILTGALQMHAAQIDAKSSKRGSKIMRSLGFATKTVHLDGSTVRRWVRVS